MLTERGRGARTPCPTRRSKPIPAKPRLDELETLLAKAKRPFVILGGTRWDEEAVADMRTHRRDAGRCRSAAPSAARCCSTTCIPNYAGDVGIGINPKLAQRDQGGRPRAPDRRPHGRDAVLRLHAAEEPLPRPDAGACPPRRRRARPRLPADAGDQRLARRLRRRLCRAQAGRSAGLGRATPKRCTPPISPGRRRPRPAPARSRWARS